MTLICGVKGQKYYSTIITDFRLTNTSTNEQYDSGLKFIQHNNSLTLFMAGSVTILGEIEKKLISINPMLDINIIDDPNSPLFQIIQNIFSADKSLNASNNSSFIAVYLDSKTKQHKIFSFDIIWDNSKWNIKNIIDDANFTWKVIGSGEIVEDKSYFGGNMDYDLKKVFDNRLLKTKNDIQDASIAIKTILSSRIDDLQRKAEKDPTNPLYNNFNNAYKYLGISPTFFRSEIIEDSFYFVSEEIETTIIEKGKMRSSKYSINKGTDSDIELKDEINNIVVKSYKTTNENIDKLIKQKKFDPDKKE